MIVCNPEKPVLKHMSSAWTSDALTTSAAITSIDDETLILRPSF